MADKFMISGLKQWHSTINREGVMKPVEHFRKLFAICPANSQALREAAFRIRYQVYCHETGFQPPHEGSPATETDEYDAQSRHCLLIHKPTNRPIGCARLIMPDSLRPELPLPFEKHWSHAIDKTVFDPDEFLPGHVVEFSRIAVIEEFRRRESTKRNTPMPPRATTAQDRRHSNFPVIPVSLCLASLSMLIAAGAEYGFVLMEPELEKLLRRVGILFEPVGNPIDYHGWRSPYLIHSDEALRYFKRGVGDLFFDINKSLQESHQQSLLRVV